MSCNIRNSNSGNPIGVYNKQGQPSKLFDQIVSNPHLNFQQSLDAYSTVYELDEEPTLLYKNNQGESFNSFSEALKTTPEGNIIAGVELGDKFQELFRVDSNTNTNNFNGLLNNLVKSDLLTGESFIDVDGKKILLAAGESELKRIITSDLALTTARGSVGYAAKQISSVGVYFDENLIGKRAIENKAGETEYITQEQLDNKSYEQLKRTTSDPLGIMAERAYKEANRAYGESTPVEDMTLMPENVLQEKLIKLLSDLGIKTVSFENYFRRNKIDPTANALADIANKIVAFKDGNISESDLTEEVSHFIVEATNPAQLENLLRNIHRTKEWSEFQQSYRDIYGKEYSGEALEEVVRKEILGKVLANSLQDNFAQNKESQTENSIIARLRDIFNQFFDNVRALFKPTHQQQLEDYTKGIYNNLMADSLYNQLSQEQLEGKEYVYYSIEQAGITPEYRQLEKTIDYLSQQQYALQKRYSAPASQNMLKEAKDSLRKSIETANTEIQEAQRLKSLLNVATVATAQLNYLNRVINQNENSGYHFAQEENSVYQNMVSKLEPMIANYNEQLKPKTPLEKQIKDKFENILKTLITLKGKIPANNRIAIENIVNRVIAKNNITGEEEQKFRNELTKVLEAGQRDTNFFHTYLGTLLHSQNIYLNLAGDVIAKTNTDARRYYLPTIKNFLNKIEAAGLPIGNLKTLIDKDGYIINETSQSLLEAEEFKEKTEAYNAATGENITPESFKDDLIDSLPTDQRILYNEQLGEIKRGRLESFFTDEHIQRLDNTFVEINGNKIYRKELPQVALEYDKFYRGQITQIRINNNGINTESDAYEISQLNKQRVIDTNPRNSDGTLKNGLREVYNNDLQRMVVEYDDSTITSNEDVLEAQKVYGLQMIDLLNKKFYEGSEKSKEIPQSFIDKLNEFETEQEKWNFVQLNAYVGFPEDYWNNFANRSGLLERLNETKDGDNNSEIDEIVEDIRSQQSIISNVLKANRRFNQPAETNVTDMTEVEMSAIKDATIQLESLYVKANSFLGESEAQEPFSEQRLNEAFRKDLQDNGITTSDEILVHILKHVTPKNKSAIEKARKVASKLIKRESVILDRSMQNVFNEDMSSDEVQTALMQFAESRLLPYYKRTEPIGYSQEKSVLDTGVENNIAGTVENYIKNSNAVQVSPSYSFYNSGENINPRWEANRAAKRPQYTEAFKAKIRNNEFYSRYGINEVGEPTKNLNEWAAREALLELQDSSIENYGLTGKHNRYLLPQQRKSTFRRITGFIGNAEIKNIRESLNDLVNYREDEGEIGQDGSGQFTSNSDIMTIPMYGVRKLENQQDVSDEVLTSYAWMQQQSALFKSRQENVSDMLALQDAILNSDYAGKSAEASNTFKMMKSFLNANYYDQKETFSYQIGIFNRKVNLGKLAKSFHRWVRYVNLTSITVPLTSFLTARVQKNVENAIGQLSNPIASKLAAKEFRKYATGAAGEVMKFNSKSKLNVLGEAFGLYDIQDRFENSNYNAATRTFHQAIVKGSGLHALGNFPVLPEILLQSLMDYRYVGTEILSYNQYIRRNQGQNKKDLDKSWQNFDLYYNDITTRNGIVEYKRENIAQKTGLEGQALDNKINQLNEVLTNRVAVAVQAIDTNISESERSVAARDARASFLLMHSNWLILSLTQRLKSYSYNTSAQTFTQGTWVTTAKFLEQMIMNRKNFKQVWNDTMADELKRKNLRRTMIDLGVGNTIGILAILMANYMDDEEDPLWGMAYFDYMTTRVANEQISGTIALPSQIAQFASDPIKASDKLKNLFKITDMFDGTEIERGNYAGYSQSFKFFSQNAPLVGDYFRIRNPKTAAQTYRHFNKDVEDYTLGSLFVQNDDED